MSSARNDNKASVIALEPHAANYSILATDVLPYDGIITLEKNTAQPNERVAVLRSKSHITKNVTLPSQMNCLCALPDPQLILLYSLEHESRYRSNDFMEDEEELASENRLKLVVWNIELAQPILSREHTLSHTAKNYRFVCNSDYLVGIYERDEQEWAIDLFKIIDLNCVSDAVLDQKPFKPQFSPRDSTQLIIPHSTEVTCWKVENDDIQFTHSLEQHSSIPHADARSLPSLKHLITWCNKTIYLWNISDPTQPFITNSIEHESTLGKCENALITDHGRVLTETHIVIDFPEVALTLKETYEKNLLEATPLYPVLIDLTLQYLHFFKQPKSIPRTLQAAMNTEEYKMQP